MLEKIKSLSKQTLIYGTSTIIGRFLNFILVPFYTNVFPPSEYGVVAVIFAYIAFLNIVYSMGFEAGYFRFAADIEKPDGSTPSVLGEGNDKQRFSIPFLIILINAGFLSSIIYLLSGPIASLAQLSASYRSIVTYAAFILFFDAIALVPFAYLRLKNKSKTFAAIKLVNIFINLGLNLYLILGLKWGLVSVFISNLAASIVTFALLTPFVFKNLTFRLNKKLFIDIAKFSIPYLPAGLASIVVQVIDKPAMQYLTDVKTVGIYQANYKLGIFMMLIVSMFEYAWKPFFLSNAKEPNAKAIFSRVMTIFLGAASVIFVLLTFFIDELVRFELPFRGHLIGEKYWPGLYIVPVVLLGYVFLGIYTNLIAGIYIEKKTKYLPAITGLAALINIAGCFGLIPFIGLMGGAIATLLSYISMAVYIYFVSQKFYRVKYELDKLFQLMAVNVLTIIFFYLMYNSIIPSGFIIKILIAVIFCLSIVWISGLWKAKNILKK